MRYAKRRTRNTLAHHRRREMLPRKTRSRANSDGGGWRRGHHSAMRYGTFTQPTARQTSELPYPGQLSQRGLPARPPVRSLARADHRCRLLGATQLVATPLSDPDIITRTHPLRPVTCGGGNRASASISNLKFHQTSDLRPSRTEGPGGCSQDSAACYRRRSGTVQTPVLRS